LCFPKELDFDDCLKTEIFNRFKKLHNPNKEAPFNTIDPFWFQYGQLAFNETEKVHGKFALKNISLYGGNKISFEKISAKINNKRMKISGQIYVPLIKYDGFYESNLKIEEFLILSEGSMNGTFEDINGKFTTIGNLIDIKDNLRQLNVSSFDIQLVIKNAKFKIDGLSKDEISSKIA
jgi:hypothetical protein